jgi:hypothetical protein
MVAPVLRHQYLHPATTLVAVRRSPAAPSWLPLVVDVRPGRHPLDPRLLETQLETSADAVAVHSGAWDEPEFALNLVAAPATLEQMVPRPIAEVVVELPGS